MSTESAILPPLASTDHAISHPLPGLLPAVEVRALTHRYGSRVALNELSLQVQTGEIFALLGPNGSGKSTLFKILATLQQPSSGSASVLGFDVVREAQQVRELIGVTFQSPSLDKKLTVWENLRYHGLLYGLRGSELRLRIEESIQVVQLQDRMADKVEKLSGGLMRRVEIAKCLMHRPRLLLLDEPSAGLDPGARRQLREQLEELRRTRGVTSILTTHLMEEADTCDRVAILDNGRLVVEGKPNQLKQAVGGEVILFWTGQTVSLSAGIKERFSLEVIEQADKVRLEHDQGFDMAARIAAAFPQWVNKVTVGRPSLEDVFLKYTGHSLDTADTDGTVSKS